MKIIETNLKGVLIIEPTLFKDERGYFYESFNHEKIKNHIGKFDIKQINKSKSTYGVVRGLHFQKPPYTQAKIVEILKGIVMDVVVDIRRDSPTFGQHNTFLLDDENENKRLLYVPRGFAHGFVTISNEAEFQYYVDNEYDKASEGGIIYDDNDIDIKWLIPNLIVSNKDELLESFRDQEFYDTADYFL